MTQEERVAEATKIIGQQLRLANALAFSIDILYNDIALRLRPLGGFKQERKRNYGIFTQKVKETLLWYEKCGLDEDFIEAAEGNWKRLDGFRAESNELVQILMLYLDRTGTYEAYDAVVKFLTELPEGGLFSAEDIARFQLPRTQQDMIPPRNKSSEDCKGCNFRVLKFDSKTQQSRHKCNQSGCWIADMRTCPLSSKPINKDRIQ